MPLPSNPGAAKTLLPQPCVLVVFGLPSTKEGEGVDPDEYIRQRARDGIGRFSRQPPEDTHWADFARGLFYVPGSFGDARAYNLLKNKLAAVDQQFGVPGSRIYYLAVPPQLVETCVQHLREAG